MSMFTFDEQSGYVSLLEHPRDAGFPVTSSQLLELFEQSSYAEFELIDANIGKLFTPSSQHNTHSLVIAKAVDASIAISVDEKNMVAEASLTTAKGGKIISMDDAQAALADAGVEKG